MNDLVQRSIQIILENQSPTGAYVASPNFPSYHYCWFRDGAFIAYAMDLVGEHRSAARFHDWAARAILRRAEVVERVLSKAISGLVLESADILHTRYTLDGEDSIGEEWPNFQLDGFGTWLWSLAQHAQIQRRSLTPDWVEAACLVSDYLAVLWNQPCYDCWEEYPDKIHGYSLAAIYGGLKAIAPLIDFDAAPVMQAIEDYVRNNLVFDDHAIKFVGTDMVDASLVGLSTPYRLLNPCEPLMEATIGEIERKLVGDGVHRYANDTYYGGGDWLLLAGWLGWYYTECGRFAQARRIKEWIENQADAEGNLPEQVPQRLIEPNQLDAWVKRWGPVATPLLWSHAKYLILSKHLQNAAE